MHPHAMTELGNCTKDDLLARLLTMSRGSLDFAKWLVADNLLHKASPPNCLGGTITYFPSGEIRFANCT